MVRESALILILSLSLYEMLLNRNRTRALILVCSILPYGLWKLFLTYRLFPVYGWTTLFYSPQVLGVPFGGIVDLYQNLFRGTYPAGRIYAALAFPCLLIIIAVFSIILLIRRRTAFCVVLVAYALIALSLDYNSIWRGIGNAERTTFEAFLFIPVALASLKDAVSRRYLFGLIGIASATLFYNCFLFSMHKAYLNALFLRGIF
jgi:hypothetical protein